ncbi:MAG: nucleotidyl transferase AbiEii/AbiGii toxin family protein [bacterium]|nr:nucleotidyl transferase AbiEii/AbiGii toxin family protein [bacterium]
MSDEGNERLSHSVRQRLLNLSRERGVDFNAVLVQFVLERGLYRLSRSPHGNRFVLKGALLFRVWTHELERPTFDIDLLGMGDPSPEGLAEIFREVLGSTEVPDGVEFDLAGMTTEEIRGGQEYGGVRVACAARIGTARVRTQIDVGFGDAVTPGPVKAELPSLLGLPAPMLLTYPRETVVAEKLEAIERLGQANSRMKDFYDLHEILERFELNDDSLADAIRATFGRRRTPIPAELPVGLSWEFAADSAKADQWAAFVRRAQLSPELSDFGRIVGFLATRLRPAIEAARDR